MNIQSNTILNQKIEDLKNELNELSSQIEKERLEASEENPSLQELLDKKEILLSELESLENPDENIAGNNSDQIGISYKIEMAGQVKTLKVVIPAEANPSEGLISSQSPLAQALINKKAGDQVEVETPIGKTVYKIKAVN
jgi:transcription elongation factor GreA